MDGKDANNEHVYTYWSIEYHANFDSLLCLHSSSFATRQNYHKGQTIELIDGTGKISGEKFKIADVKCLITDKLRNYYRYDVILEKYTD